jgi:energy-coupling factor transport system permease protein
MPASPRLVHPAAWWIWAGCLAGAAMHTTNPFLLALTVVVVAFVVASRRQPTPWAKSFGAFVKLGAVLIGFRMVLQMFFGVRFGTTTLFALPAVDLPDWAAGVSFGGTVTLEMLLDAFYQSMRLGVVLVCFGAVNALCSPYRLLRCLPAVLYEAGVVVTIALSFAPQTVMSVGRVREARRLRGRPTRGLRGMQGMAMPVLESALERSVSLAASMDVRGYGRRGEQTVRARRVVALATGIGLLAVCIGVYGLLDLSAPRFLSLPMLGVGSAALAVVLFSKGRHSSRSRYRSDPWKAAEWVVGGSGLASLVLLIVAASLDPVALTPVAMPVAVPALPVLPIVGILLAVLPAWCTPAPPATVPTVRDRLGERGDDGASGDARARGDAARGDRRDADPDRGITRGAVA